MSRTGGNKKRLPKLYFEFELYNRTYKGHYNYQQFVENCYTMMQHRYPFLPKQLLMSRVKKLWNTKLNETKQSVENRYGKRLEQLKKIKVETNTADSKSRRTSSLVISSSSDSNDRGGGTTNDKSLAVKRVLSFDDHSKASSSSSSSKFGDHHTHRRDVLSSISDNESTLQHYGSPKKRMSVNASPTAYHHHHHHCTFDRTDDAISHHSLDLSLASSSPSQSSPSSLDSYQHYTTKNVSKFVSRKNEENFADVSYLSSESLSLDNDDDHITHQHPISSFDYDDYYGHSSSSLPFDLDTNISFKSADLHQSSSKYNMHSTLVGAASKVSNIQQDNSTITVTDDTSDEKGTMPPPSIPPPPKSSSQSSYSFVSNKFISLCSTRYRHLTPPVIPLESSTTSSSSNRSSSGTSSGNTTTITKTKPKPKLTTTIEAVESSESG